MFGKDKKHDEDRDPIREALMEILENSRKFQDDDVMEQLKAKHEGKLKAKAVVIETKPEEAHSEEHSDTEEQHSEGPSDEPEMDDEMKEKLRALLGI